MSAQLRLIAWTLNLLSTLAQAERKTHSNTQTVIYVAAKLWLCDNDTFKRSISHIHTKNNKMGIQLHMFSVVLVHDFLVHINIESICSFMIAFSFLFIH